jgi:hypothetical protein
MWESRMEGSEGEDMSVDEARAWSAMVMGSAAPFDGFRWRVMRADDGTRIMRALSSYLSYSHSRRISQSRSRKTRGREGYYRKQLPKHIPMACNICQSLTAVPQALVLRTTRTVARPNQAQVWSWWSRKGVSDICAGSVGTWKAPSSC